MLQLVMLLASSFRGNEAAWPSHPPRQTMLTSIPQWDLRAQQRHYCTTERSCCCCCCWPTLHLTPLLLLTDLLLHRKWLKYQLRFLVIKTHRTTRFVCLRIFFLKTWSVRRPLLSFWSNKSTFCGGTLTLFGWERLYDGGLVPERAEQSGTDLDVRQKLPMRQWRSKISPANRAKWLG